MLTREAAPEDVFRYLSSGNEPDDAEFLDQLGGVPDQFGMVKERGVVWRVRQSISLLDDRLFPPDFDLALWLDGRWQLLKGRALERALEIVWSDIGYWDEWTPRSEPDRCVHCHVTIGLADDLVLVDEDDWTSARLHVACELAYRAQAADLDRLMTEVGDELDF